MAGRRRVELGEHRLLDLDPLGNGLDHEVDVAEAVVARRAGDPADDLLRLRCGLLGRQPLPFDEPRELALGDLARMGQAGVDQRLVDVLEHDGQPGGGDGLGDLATHRPRPHDGDLEDEHAEPP